MLNILMARSVRPKHLHMRFNHFKAAHLGKCEANYAQLSPLVSYNRTIETFPAKPAYTYEDKMVTWGSMGKRVSRLASAVSKLGIQRGEVVSFMASNTPPMLEAHFALPGLGVVLHPINTRLDATTIAYQLKHSESKVVFVDSEFNTVMREAKTILQASNTAIPKFINIRDTFYEKDHAIDESQLIGSVEYEDFIAEGDEQFQLKPCVDEWDAISLNYTSGTTGNPKGVVGTHRGAYLNAIANIVEWNMERFADLLWVVPMFHCNGWMFPWSMCHLGGCNHLLRYVRAPQIFNIVEKYQIRYLTGAPITMTTLLSDPSRRKFTHGPKMWTAGSPPPPSVMRRFEEELGVTICTAYGLTETYGPVTTHIPQDWSASADSTAPGQDALSVLTHQVMDAGVSAIKVLDPETMKEVPPDSRTLGEIMIKGNIVMAGYFKNPTATEESFAGGWFHSGDLAVNHGNGRFEIKDRSKDIIISGGENISSIEIQDIMITHPGVMEVAVVAMPHEKWGEVPCAFVARDPSATDPEHRAVTEAELIAWTRTKMPHYQAPKKIVFGDIPKTSTGKVQKNKLKEMLDDLLKLKAKSSCHTRSL